MTPVRRFSSTRFDMKLKLTLLISGIALALILLELGLHLTPHDRGRSLRSARPWYYYQTPERPERARPVEKRPKAAGDYRVAVLGDSFTFPHRLQFDDTFPARLERILKLADVHTEVINYGVEGYSTFHQVPVAKQALKDGADLILLQITLNDAEQETFRRAAKKQPERYIYGDLRVSRRNTPLLYYSRLARFIASRIHNERSLTTFIQYHNDLFEEHQSWNQFSNSITQIAEACSRSGAGFAAIIFPMFYFKIDEDYPFHTIHRKIANHLSHEQIAYIDLLKTFWMIPRDRLIISLKDPHPNEIAHRMAADDLYAWLSASMHIPATVRTALLTRAGRSQRPINDIEKVYTKHLGQIE